MLVLLCPCGVLSLSGSTMNVREGGAPYRVFLCAMKWFGVLRMKRHLHSCIDVVQYLHDKGSIASELCHFLVHWIYPCIPPVTPFLILLPSLHHVPCWCKPFLCFLVYAALRLLLAVLYIVCHFLCHFLCHCYLSHVQWVMFCSTILSTSQEVLKPHAYQANLDIWSFYTENSLSRFPPYDCELLSHVDLTLEDITHGYFSQSVLQGLRPLSATEVTSNYLELVLIKYEQLKQQPQISTNSGAMLPSGWKAHWNLLQDHSASLLSQLAPCYRPPLVSGGISVAVLLCCVVMEFEEHECLWVVEAHWLHAMQSCYWLLSSDIAGNNE